MDIVSFILGPETILQSWKLVSVPCSRWWQIRCIQLLTNLDIIECSCTLHTIVSTDMQLDSFYRYSVVLWINDQLQLSCIPLWNMWLKRWMLKVRLTPFAPISQRLSIILCRSRYFVTKTSEFSFGIPLLNLIKSYLYDRQFFAYYNRFFSIVCRVTSGGPHGSHLVSLLFLLFINDIVENISCNRYCCLSMTLSILLLVIRLTIPSNCRPPYWSWINDAYGINFPLIMQSAKFFLLPGRNLHCFLIVPCDLIIWVDVIGYVTWEYFLIVA